MNKSAIKNFAISARIKLKDQIKQKVYAFGVTKYEIVLKNPMPLGVGVSEGYFIQL